MYYYPLCWLINDANRYGNLDQFAQLSQNTLYNGLAFLQRDLSHAKNKIPWNIVLTKNHYFASWFFWFILRFIWGAYFKKIQDRVFSDLGPQRYISRKETKNPKMYFLCHDDVNTCNVSRKTRNIYFSSNHFCKQKPFKNHKMNPLFFSSQKLLSKKLGKLNTWQLPAYLLEKKGYGQQMKRM